jgi:hypothetical protein
MAEWRVTDAGRWATSAEGSDTDGAWYVSVEGAGIDQVEVRVREGLLEMREHGVPIAEESEWAFRTSGRSAVEKFSDHHQPPPVIVVGTEGVLELA